MKARDPVYDDLGEDMTLSNLDVIKIFQTIIIFLYLHVQNTKPRLRDSMIKRHLDKAKKIIIIK